MFDRVDNFLVTYLPLWYRTPLVQTVTLGVVFFWVFAAYTTIQFYSASIYGSNLAADSVSAVYLTFTLSCLIAPAIINKCGCRLSLFMGVLGYASLVLASLIYFLYGGDDKIWSHWLVVIAGAVLGVGAATLWTAQGRLILQYAAKADELEQEQEERKSSGKILSIFWAIFQCSSLVGGTISFIYYNQEKTNGLVALYFIFLSFIIIGAFSTQLLLPPSILQGNSSKINDDIVEAVKNGERQQVKLLLSEQTPFNTTIDQASLEKCTAQNTNNNNKKINEDLSDQSWWQEACSLLQMILDRRMLCLSVLFMYTGLNQPYQQATFGNRFFTKRTIGVELILFHLMEIIGAIVVGRFLDGKWSNRNNNHKSLTSNQSRRVRAILCLTFFIVINGIGNAVALMQEYSAKNESHPKLAHDISNFDVALPSLAFICWGFADAQIQVYCYWLMGEFYTSGNDHSRAVGWYKCMQSLGTSIGFYFIPASRMIELSQLKYSSLFFVIGTALSFTQLPC